MIKIEQLHFAYGEKQIFKNFSLEIADGSRICLFGNSGCGKTTLLRLLMGLEKPDQGTISFSGANKISAVFQENRLLPFLTAEENIKIVGTNQEKAEKILKCLDIADCKQKRPHGLSGGMKRRVSLARALSVEFDILLLDEPFNGLDEGNIQAAAEVINEYSTGKTLILVTHFEEQAKLLNCELLKL